MARQRWEAAWGDERRRPRVPGAFWLALVVVAGVGVIYLGFRTVWNFQTVSIEVWSCQEQLRDEQSWSEVEQADCRPVSTDEALVRILLDGDPREDVVVDDDAYHVEGVPLDWSKVTIEVRTPGASASHIALVDGEAQPPQVIRDFTLADVGQQRWVTQFGSEPDHTRFRVVIGAPATR